eukprot:TRINITY_DN2051_c0_g1_i1.p1 TRINITY_DN2051_c0_g1~~TRINITY_DN2051_c0_g1_i1.p1  ORF type:complete len:350 (-),score=66.67 TRINITY_DN2051_c0_g1_i1:20-1069(-)
MERVRATFEFTNTVNTIFLISLVITVAVAASIDRVTESESFKPNRLKKGQIIGFISPASTPHVNIKQYVDKIHTLFGGMGYSISFGSHSFSRYGYLAGTDKERVEDIHDMFSDPSISAIIANRGGWGCNRLIDLVDYDLISRNPKIIMGYSDLTSLLNAIHFQTGLITFHGPMGIDKWIDTEKTYFRDILVDGKLEMLQNIDGVEIKTYRGGIASGKLIGGNLSVFVAMIGSDYLPDPRTISGTYILFMEDVEEAPYRIDRMMTTLHLSGWLSNAAGFVFGRCTECTTKDIASFTLEQVLEQKLGGMTVPTFSGAMFGHIDHQYILPIGLNVTMDATQGTIAFNSPAVN